jgi:hypothetical protein
MNLWVALVAGFVVGRVVGWLIDDVRHFRTDEAIRADAMRKFRAVSDEAERRWSRG